MSSGHPLGAPPPEGEAHPHSAPGDGVNAMAVSATLHCLSGCAIGEVAGLMIGAGAGLGNAWTVVISIALAFVFGYTLSVLPLLAGGLALGSAMRLVLAADTLSIATMELVDNLVVVVVPGAMDAGLADALFWLSTLLSLVVAFFAAWPVNRVLLQRGRGHALTHGHHGAATRVAGWRRFIPHIGTGALVAVILAFMLGGLIVAIAA